MTAHSISSTTTAQPIEFLLCGSPNDAFYSQMAFFRLSLDRLGDREGAARLVAVFGGEHYPPLPARWRSAFERIEIHRAAPDEFRRRRYFAASDLRYRLLDPNAHLSVLCDADTAMLRPLPRSLLDQATHSPTISAVIAHFPFPISRDTRDSKCGVSLCPSMPQHEAWDRIGTGILGRPPKRPYRYTLLQDAGDTNCPFYINYGFLAGPPRLLQELHERLERLQPRVAELLENDFYGQVAIALAVEEGGLPERSLPMRFNFPNDREADRLYPLELENVVLMHYLRNAVFDRHRIFATPEGFQEFLRIELTGSDAVFRDHVLRITGGSYPFECSP